MTVERRQIQGGIFLRHATRISGQIGQEERAALFEAFGSPATFEGCYGVGAEAWARSVLIAVGIDNNHYKATDGHGEAMGWTAVAEARGFAPGTAEHYAARLMLSLGLVRRAISNGNAAEAAWLACEYGRLTVEIGVIFEHEDDAIRGKKTAKGAKEGGRLRGRQTAERDKFLAREFLKRSGGGGVSESALKARIGRNQSQLSRSASIAAIDRGLKILS